MENQILQEILGVYGAFGIIYLIYYLIALGISVVMYVLESVGLYTIAKRRNISNPWLAWIPFGVYWIMGSISDDYHLRANGKVKNRRMTLLIWYIVLIALAIFTIGTVVNMVIGTVDFSSGTTNQYALLGDAALIVIAYLLLLVCSIVVTVLMYMALYDLYASCDPDNKVLYLVLGIFVNVLMPILIFICRNKDGGMPAPQQPTSYGYVLPHATAYQPPVYQQPTDQSSDTQQ